MQAAGQRVPLRIWAARIGGVEIPNKKMIEFSLQYVYGIGHTTAKAILSETVSALHVTWTAWYKSTKAVSVHWAALAPSSCCFVSRKDLRGQYKLLAEPVLSRTVVSQLQHRLLCTAALAAAKQCAWHCSGARFLLDL